MKSQNSPLNSIQPSFLKKLIKPVKKELNYIAKKKHTDKRFKTCLSVPHFLILMGFQFTKGSPLRKKSPRLLRECMSSEPIEVTLLGLLFRETISRAIGRVNEIEVKGVKLKMSQIEEAVDEHERLKAAIEIATAGKEINIPEVKALQGIAAGMQTYLIKPKEQFIKRLLRSAL